MTVIFLGRKLSGRFVIPSGILTTKVAIIERVAEMIPEVGVITTKSIGVEPEAGYREPILCEASPLNFVNAVGLRNPGMDALYDELWDMRERHENDGLFDEKFLMVSIYGKTEEEFQKLVKRLAPVADGLELNLSCPHSKPGYGAYIGSHPDTTHTYTQAAVEAARETGIPIFVKLTPNVQDIGAIAESALKAGASGITAINTVGPIGYCDPVSGEPILTHVTGGKSGRLIKDIGAKAVQTIRERVGPSIPIIGMGGIASAEDVLAYHGADLLGVGSALAGLDLNGIAGFFRQLEFDLQERTDMASSLLIERPLMNYRKFHIKEIQKIDDDLRVFVLDGKLEFLPSQFVFLWLPGKGEKPFSPALQDPLTIAIRKRGILTSEFFRLRKGNRLMVRGPYGRGFIPDRWENVFILAGGTGSGAALSLARSAYSLEKRVTVFQGSTSERQVLFGNEFRALGEFIPCIDRDEPGEVLKVMKEYLDKNRMPESSMFFNIGPEIMMKEGMKIESRFLPDTDIFASVEQETLCGVGLCGNCELNGYRTCIRGTVFSLASLKEWQNGGFLK